MDWKQRLQNVYNQARSREERERKKQEHKDVENQKKFDEILSRVEIVCQELAKIQGLPLEKNVEGLALDGHYVGYKGYNLGSYSIFTVGSLDVGVYSASVTVGGRVGVYGKDLIQKYRHKRGFTSSSDSSDFAAITMYLSAFTEENLGEILEDFIKTYSK